MLHWPSPCRLRQLISRQRMAPGRFHRWQRQRRLHLLELRVGHVGQGDHPRRRRVRRHGHQQQHLQRRQRPAWRGFHLRCGHDAGWHRYVGAPGHLSGRGTNDGGSPNLEAGSAGNVALGTTGLDVRQVYMTFGNKDMGTFELGRNIGLFEADIILNDMTLLGVGGPATRPRQIRPIRRCGGIGFGYSTRTGCHRSITRRRTSAVPT